MSRYLIVSCKYGEKRVGHLINHIILLINYINTSFCVPSFDVNVRVLCHSNLFYIYEALVFTSFNTRKMALSHG
jgi:hypothetical protein